MISKISKKETNLMQTIVKDFGGDKQVKLRSQIKQLMTYQRARIRSNMKYIIETI